MDTRGCTLGGGESLTAPKTHQQAVVSNGKEEGETLALEGGADRDHRLVQESGLRSWAVPSSCPCFPCSQANMMP